MDKRKLNNRKLRCLTLAGLIIIASIYVSARTVEREIADEEGNRYVGDTVGGVIHGVGRYDWADGSSYEGDFKNGEVHGEGTMRYPDGSTYSGTFNRSQRHGYGVLTLENGDTYSGTFVEDRMTGVGEWISESLGESYRGSWRDGQRHGTGILTWEDGSQYIGSFLNNEMHGFGERTDTNSQTYRGYFKFNRQHGDGILETDAQTRHFQSWQQGKLIVDELIREIDNCKLVIGDQPWMFQGDECVDGLAHGTGRAVALDGSAYVNYGTYVLGTLVTGVILSMTLPEDFDAP